VSITVDVVDPWEAAGSVGPEDGAVIVDVFRATSTIQVLTDQDCTVIPLREVPGASPAAGVLRVGEWQGVTPLGFAAGNSPVEVMSECFRSAVVEFISSNGVAAILAVRHAMHVLCGSLFNEKSVPCAVGSLTEGKMRWWLIPAGCRGSRRPEDDYVCAKIGERLLASGVTAAPRAADFIGRNSHLSERHLRESPGARFLIENGAQRDLAFILESGYVSTSVPHLRPEGIRNLSH